MELKRGWWKFPNYTLLLAGEHLGKWYGMDELNKPSVWDSSILRVMVRHRKPTYCGDGPEPVEPVQLCLGWWERADKSTTKIVTPTTHNPPRWIDNDGTQYTVDGDAINLPGSRRNIVRRRPDLDAKEAAEKQPDPRDTEIERLKERVEQLAYENMQLIGMKAELKNQLNNLRRLIGDH